MRRIAIGNTILRLAVLSLAWIVPASAEAQGWGPATGDEKNAAQGCAVMPGDEYVCTFVRCDAKGSLNFYAAAPGPDITGNVVMDIDGQRFPMTFRGPGSPHLAHTNKADAPSPGFFAALKTGKVLKIRDAGLKAGYDTIPLRNADREIGRLETMCGIAAAAQTPAPAAVELPRAGAIEGAAFCKANLASAPPGLMLGEVEQFCTCMGVQETAMFRGDMTDAAKASLRPQLQQMCVAIVRNQAQSPGQAAAPAVPSATPPAPPVAAQPAPAASPRAAEAPRNPFFGLWAESQSICTEAGGNDIPDVDGFVFIGEKTTYDRHTRCQITRVTGSGQERSYDQSCWAEGEEKKFSGRGTYALLAPDTLQLKLASGPSPKLTLCTRETPGWVKQVGRSLFKIVEAPAQAPTPIPVEKHRALTIASNRSGAPIAYVRATPSQEMVEGGETPPAPKVEALLLYCRAKDSVGARVLFKPGVRESVVSIGSAGHRDDLKLDQNGVVTNVDRWASFVKKSEFFERKPDIASGPLHVELDLPQKGSRNSMASDPGGSVSLAGLTAARARMRALCAEAIANGAAAGNYDTTGIDGFPEEALVIPSPGQISAVAPQPKPAAPALGEAECRALLKRTGDAMMPKMQRLIPALNNVSSPAQFCNASRQTVAFHNEVKQRIAACSAHGFVKKLIGESNTAISTARAQMRQVGC